jgi:hypothetical protein
MLAKYILNSDGEPERCDDDLERWAIWFEFADRSVLQDRYNTLLVSTIFLSLDHSFSRSGPPVLWETMVFDERDDGHRTALEDYTRRYTSKLDALEGHREVCIQIEALVTK